MTAPPGRSRAEFRFAAFTLDPSRRVLSRRRRPIRLEPRVFDLLAFLVQSGNRVVSKEELVAEVWRGAFVTDSALKRAVAEARRALGDDGKRQRYIETVFGHGYRFRAPTKKRPPTPRRRVLWTSLVVAGVATLGAWLSGSLSSRGPAASPAPAAPPRIVVLPFVNTGPRELDPIAVGLTTELTSRLAELLDLGVLSSTTAFAYEHQGKPVGSIGSELNVAFLIEGSIGSSPFSGDPRNLRVSPHLVDTAADRVLWAASYDRPLGEIFSVEGEIAWQVAEHLGLTLAARERQALDAPSTSNLEAHQTFLRGRAHLEAFDGDLELASELFSRAVGLDPDYAEAWASLALASARRCRLHPGTGQSSLRTAGEAAHRALALAPDSLGAQRALAEYYYLCKHEPERALELLDRAQSVRGPTADLLRDIGLVLRSQGAFDAALAQFHDAVAIDPLSAVNALLIGETEMIVHRYSEADAAFQHALRLAPDLQPAYSLRAWNQLLREGDTEGAWRTLQAMPKARDAQSLYYTVQVLLATGHAGEVLQLTTARPAEIWQGEYVFYPAALAEGRAHSLAGHVREARAAYERARALLESHLPEQADDPRLRSSLGLALAGLGEADRALVEARRGVELAPIRQNAFLYSRLRQCDLAETLVLVGHLAEAANLLAELAQPPSWLSESLLRVDPRWRPLDRLAPFRLLLSKVRTGRSTGQTGPGASRPPRLEEPGWHAVTEGADALRPGPSHLGSAQ